MTKMRSYLALSTVALLAITLLASCSEPTGARLWRSYTLVSVDNTPLPYALVDILSDDGKRFRRVHLADTIQLLTETGYRRSSVLYEEFPPLPSDTFPSSWEGTYSRRGDTLTLNLEIIQPPSNVITTVSEFYIVSRGTLRVKRQVGPHCTAGSVECYALPLVDFVYAGR
ncbi:MAG: hypothetical protein M3P00_08355 [Gemmatimonadota bacterium]|nr:hypothetical protein [Gemmatimonadota bacterium]